VEKIRTFFAGFAGKVTPLLLLDYDGTLAPFCVDRFLARPWAGVRELLTRIQQHGRTRMAIISGRSAHEIRPLLGIDSPLEVWGLHGAERLFPNGRRELQPAPAAAREKLEMLRALLKRDSFGGLFEDKANAAVLHWRGASVRKAMLSSFVRPDSSRESDEPDDRLLKQFNVKFQRFRLAKEQQRRPRGTWGKMELF
jgi:trehalose-phosphatase